jgi:Rrf2 family iron-sulfur cluster assembly transcriptional regulator
MDGKLNPYLETNTMLNKKTIHAIHALVHIASLPQGVSISTTDLSRQLHLSVSYLESLLKVLRENKLVSSTRGPGGGYELALPAAQLSVWSVAQAFDDRSKLQAPTSVYQIDLDALLGGVIESQFQSILSSIFIGNYTHEVDPLDSRNGPNDWRFGFKPLAPSYVPVAPNSVFQLSQFMGLRASA